MTVDERLDRLTECHEALTQTVELIAAAQLQAKRVWSCLRSAPRNSWTP